MEKTTYWELSDGRVLRVENSKRNDLVNENPLLEAGCQAVLIRDERFTWLEMGGEYLVNLVDREDELTYFIDIALERRWDDGNATAGEAVTYFTMTYGSGVFVKCKKNMSTGEHLCDRVFFRYYDEYWWDATAWLVVPAGVDVDKVLDDYVLWMNGYEVQVFDNVTGELIEAVLSSDDHEKIVRDHYDVKGEV